MYSEGSTPKGLLYRTALLVLYRRISKSKIHNYYPGCTAPLQDLLRCMLFISLNNDQHVVFVTTRNYFKNLVVRLIRNSTSTLGNSLLNEYLPVRCTERFNEQTFPPPFTRLDSRVNGGGRFAPQQQPARTRTLLQCSSI